MLTPLFSMTLEKLEEDTPVAVGRMRTRRSRLCPCWLSICTLWVDYTYPTAVIAQRTTYVYCRTTLSFTPHLACTPD